MSYELCDISCIVINVDLFQCVISSKSNEFKNTIDIIQSAFETNMASIETQFMAKVGTPVMFSGDKSTYCLCFYEMLAYLYANFAHSLRQTLSSYQHQRSLIQILLLKSSSFEMMALFWSTIDEKLQLDIWESLILQVTNTDSNEIKTDLSNLTKKMKTLELSNTEFSLVLSMMLFTTDRSRINNDEKILVDDENFPNKTSLAEEYERLAEMLRQSIENNPKRKKQNNKHIFAKVIEGLTLSRSIGVYLRSVLQKCFQNEELANKYQLLAEVVKDHDTNFE